MECEYCKNSFASKVSLYLHQTRSKYCLEKQGKQPKKEWCCDECGKNFTQSTNCKRHQKICGQSKRKRIKTIDAQIKALEQEKEKLQIKLAKEDAELQLILGDQD